MCGKVILDAGMWESDTGCRCVWGRQVMLDAGVYGTSDTGCRCIHVEDK